MSQRVDFYVLNENSGRDRFACSIAQKAWLAGNRVYIQSGTREAALQLDDLLWMFSDISFVPHALNNSSDAEIVPVVIGWQDNAAGHFNTLINLTPDVPDNMERYERIVEIVAGNEDERVLARDRYKRYRDRGCELHKHDIDRNYDDA